MTQKVLKTNPQFKSQWLALTKDENGKSMYRSFFNGVMRKLGDFEEFRTSYTQKEFASGFASDYARTSFLEDVAELGSMAETGAPYHRVIEAEPNLSKDSPLIKKIHLSEDAGLIPKEFTKHLEVQRKYLQCVSPHLPGLARSDRPYAEFYHEAKQFIDKYPQSRYILDIKEKIEQTKEHPLASQ